MGDVIEIRFSEDMPSTLQNTLRFRMEMARWKERKRAAEAAGNYALIDSLESEYEMVGMP